MRVGHFKPIVPFLREFVEIRRKYGDALLLSIMSAVTHRPCSLFM